MRHITVLLDEAVEALALSPNAHVVDATFGSGGHARNIVSKLGPKGIYLGIDADATAFKHADDIRRGAACSVIFKVGNFKAIDTHVAECAGMQPNAILADLGWRMEQFSGNGKGFSFQHDEPLLMTYGDPKEYPFTARDIVNEWDAEHIATVLKGYSEERAAFKIAAAIVNARMQRPIQTTFDLVQIIESVNRPNGYRSKIHPATRTFQALRIAVNDEWSVVDTLIQKSVSLLTSGGRLVIITFHSIEDRVVKHTFKELAEKGIGRVCTKKPIRPSAEEILRNPRSRSAQLRIFEKK